jgi:transposase-like protein
MGNVMNELMKRIHQLTEEQAEKAVEAIDRIISEDERSDDKVSSCPHCGSTAFVRNGVKSGKQRYKCKGCGISFVYTTKTGLRNSRFGEAAWKQAINDALEGVSLDRTAESLGTSHATAFNMRHKILSGLETFEAQRPTVLSGVCEVDDTYVLENYKGARLPDDFWRGARRHGAKAQKRGISSEYVSVQTGVMRDGKIYTKSVNRATPGVRDIEKAFAGHFGRGTLVLCDGAKSYGALSGTCEVRNIDRNAKGDFSHINNANGYHSFIKQRYAGYRGVATKYLNRYNALFSKAYNYTSSLADSIYDILCLENGDLYRKVDDLKTANLLEL